MLPAQQGFKAAQAAAIEVDLRLVDQHKVIIVDGVAQAFLKHQPRTRAAIHFRREEAILLTPRTLGLVHGHVRSAQQALDVLPALGEAGNANARPQGHVHAVDGVPHRDLLDQLLGNPRGILGVLQAVEQCGELITADARQAVIGAQAGLELLTHTFEQLVASIVTERIIDPLEAIQIKVQHGHALATAINPRQRRVQRLVEPSTIEQPRQRIGDGLRLQLLMQVAHHRHVQRHDHHGMLQTRQGRAGQRHWHLATAQGTQVGIMQAVGLATPPLLIELGQTPLAGHLGSDQIGKHFATFQITHGAVEHACHGRVGETDATVFAHHHDAFGGVIQHRGIEGTCAVQLLAELQQLAAVALVFQQGVDFVAQHTGVEWLEHKVHRPGGVALEHRILGLRDGRNEDDRGIACARVAAHQTGHFKTVHVRHLHIQQHQSDILFQQALQCRLAGIHAA